MPGLVTWIGASHGCGARAKKRCRATEGRPEVNRISGIGPWMPPRVGSPATARASLRCWTPKRTQNCGVTSDNRASLGRIKPEHPVFERHGNCLLDTRARGLAEPWVPNDESCSALGALVKRILVVEDNEMNRDALSRRLIRQGYDVVLAVDGLHGLELAEATRPDLILMDLGMPALDGWESARRLKQAPETASIPIIALTAHAMVGDRAKALEAGCDDFDTKPIRFAVLVEKIDRLLEMSDVIP